MDLKLLEDLAALANERSFVRAAEARHVTHPAFGRRIRALESWVGVPLVDRTRTPVQLTAAGQALLSQGQPLLETLLQTREQLRHRHPELGGEVLRIATGRTLAHTLVADWLGRLTRPRQPLHGQRVDVRTGTMTEVVLLLERGDADLLWCYEHPETSVRVSSQRFRHLSFASDKLVPVSRADAQGRPLHTLEKGPLVDYAPQLSLGALVHEHLRRSMPEAALRTRYVCDSPDALLEFVVRGFGLGWLPWSMVATRCKDGTLVPLGTRSEEVHFEVRLYRARARQSALVEAVWAATDQ